MENKLYAFYQAGKKENEISNELYRKYNVKKGLRNEDGTGVRVGLTRIADVVGYEIKNKEKCDVLGKLLSLIHIQMCIRDSIKDEGEGIKDYDLPRIFDRGYVGSNHHNGEYKSTGMGLYMVNLMIKKLGHQITVDSQYQQYTCFCITFQNIEKHFNL